MLFDITEATEIIKTDEEGKIISYDKRMITGLPSQLRNDDNEYSLKVLREERKYWEFYNRLESENDRMLEDRELDRWDQEREGFSLKLKM